MVVQCSVGHSVHQTPFKRTAPWLYAPNTSLKQIGAIDAVNGTNSLCCPRMALASGPPLARPRSQWSDGSASLRPARRLSAPISTAVLASTSNMVLLPEGDFCGRIQAKTSSTESWQSSFSFYHSPLPSPAPTTSLVPLASQHSLRIGLKRKRPLSDVDGVDTANLPVKKRRLRLHLITSRLSRPFSVPATHILNREAIAGGSGEGKRFVKLTAYITARRAAVSAAQHTTTNHNPSSVDLLRRAAILNRVRLAVRASTQIRQFGATRDTLNQAAAVANHGMQLVSAAHYFFPAPSTPAPPPPQHQAPVIFRAARRHYYRTPSRMYAAPGPTPVTQHYGALLPRTLPPQSDSNTPTPPVQAPRIEYHHAKLPPSPKLKASGGGSRNRRLGPSPLSSPPVMRPARERDFDEEDELDNDNVSFPVSELGNPYADDYDDDEEQNGCDLDAIFGGATGGVLTPDEIDDMEFEMLDDESAKSNEHYYEEYLDELDGIPRTPPKT